MMDRQVRTPDGNIADISLKSGDGGLVGHGLRFERSGSTDLVMIDSDGRRRKVLAAKVDDSWWIHLDGRAWKVELIEAGSNKSGDADAGLSAPMPGTILELLIEVGEEVVSGQALLVMEAMKMEYRITAPHDGIVTAIEYQTGERVEQGASLITLE